MKKIVILAAFIAAVGVSFAMAADAVALKPQTTCPVMKGNAIDKKLFVDYEGKRIYVCCNVCLAEVKKDPAKYLAELKTEGQEPEVIAAAAKPIEAAPAAVAPAAATTLKPQTTCPVMKGNPIDKKLFVDADGKRIYVCCKGCIAQVKKDPAKAIAELKSEGQEPIAIPVETKKVEEKK